MIDRKIIEELADTLRTVFPSKLSEEADRTLRAALSAALDRMGLVTREELDIQEAVLARTREKLEALERQVEALENQLKERD